MTLKVLVVGAGVVGAACAFHASLAGLDVTVIDRGPVGAGTTSRGEGNILLSDKEPGPELELAHLSRALWDEAGEELGADSLEFESKGGLVVASTDEGLPALRAFAERQAAAGVLVEPVDRVHDLEPHLAPGIPGGVHYPQDAQVQPVLAAAALLRAAVARGARFHTGEVAAAVTDPDGRVTGIRTTAGDVLPADAVVNAAGTWGGEVGRRLGAPIEVLPRRGFVLVTEPLPPMVRHKVYSADYVANVASSDAGLETSCVVEGTRGGTILIGASRERVGFDTTMNPAVVTKLAAQACRLFPFLSEVQVIRAYRGFRPYCPDHLPVIGPDPRVPGVVHACGHEGAGIGLAPATGALVTAHLLGRPWHGADPAAHAGLLPDRFFTSGGGSE
ncbi:MULTISPECIES: NAD(P)/FAD-dependent oxidoreductase [Streptomyces]|uniref:FAD-binding oxidoreductase n=2 Tax=Streptomyces TaxID=1883 RepID=A0A420UWS3_9ACTN|nr:MULTISPECIES: FAD-dependent oxidoreductase [Streptomyces]KNE83856.1 FAD-dependent oxidoreductase [Streptomyces fradiae]OFA55733.1 FAD-dependent oxidoreductase [Streptomyces fradiae]PQM23913.1 FAD-binding oxidoreductase [Streptomyces xinghaiensis]RKM91978.1 FAD-binding oxidoreductase [Streptomyces xinghaiensis]RNC73605.1 FAD-binding oxidoreductase [Streptomyces xinghaiensis]